MRRPRVDWLTRADDAILEFRLNEGNRPLVATPSTVEANIDYRMITLIEAVTEFLAMEAIVRGLISVALALLLGFSVSFVVSPDPTGITPVIVGLVLTGVLIPAFYFGLRRTSSNQQLAS
ncbi:hypothetical protein SAMN04489841_2814 [Natrinema salaciae]|uniref:Uncharacterized protein n=1 Tax=Natrinema salaciae TaxID=1186196 RepID=A0A1H9K5R0_9EURY|nr:hypothetical protein SAMN04489841_2814 [Natrinema salaciae]